MNRPSHSSASCISWLYRSLLTRRTTRARIDKLRNKRRTGSEVREVGGAEVRRECCLRLCVMATDFTELAAWQLADELRRECPTTNSHLASNYQNARRRRAPL